MQCITPGSLQKMRKTQLMNDELWRYKHIPKEEAIRKGANSEKEAREIEKILAELDDPRANFTEWEFI